MMEIRGLTKRFGDVTAIDGIDLAVGERELCVLLGPSGCGKSTALRCVAGLEKPESIDGISVVNALMGKPQKEEHDYLYWDYGHCRERYDQAVRMGEWKGIRLGYKNKIQLYNLDNDLGEENNIAGKYPEIVAQIEVIMDEAFVPNDLYQIGRIYKGSPIWKKNK